MWDKKTCVYPFSNFIGTTVYVFPNTMISSANYFIWHYCLCDFLSMLGLKIIGVSKRGHWNEPWLHYICKCENVYDNIKLKFVSKSIDQLYPFLRSKFQWYVNGCASDKAISLFLCTHKIQFSFINCLPMSPIAPFTNRDLLYSQISNHMLSRVWDEITYPFLNSNGCAQLKFRNE